MLGMCLSLGVLGEEACCVGCFVVVVVGFRPNESGTLSLEMWKGWRVVFDAAEDVIVLFSHFKVKRVVVRD